MLNNIETILLFILSIALLLVVFSTKLSVKKGYTISFLTLGGSFIYLLQDLGDIFSSLIREHTFNSMLIYDSYSLLFTLIFLLSSSFLLLISKEYIINHKYFNIESFIFIIFSVFGMILLSMSNDFIVAFISLEIASMSIYVLVGINKYNLKSSEAFLKYLVIGSFMGGFYLLGLALIFIQSGSTSFIDLAKYISTHSLEQLYLVILGGLFIMATLMFKISAFPFYAWSLDIYDGAPLPITSLMAGVFKISIFSLMLRVFLSDYIELKDLYDPLIILASILTMLVGSFLAISQQSIKRLLAASSIVHSGYLLVALSSIATIGDAASYSLIFYLIAYFLSAIGSLGVLSMINSKEDITFETLKGFASTNPFLALMMSIFMLSLAGFPSSIGFLGKFYIFSSAIEASLTPLAIFGAITAFISIYYYFKVIASMYFHKNTSALLIYSNIKSYIIIFIISFLVLYLGIGSSYFTYLPGTNDLTEFSKSIINSL